MRKKLVTFTINELFLFHNLSVFVEVHFAIHNIAEQAFALGGANRDEVRAGLGVVVAGQANRAPMVLVRVVWHHTWACILHHPV